MGDSPVLRECRGGRWGWRVGASQGLADGAPPLCESPHGAESDKAAADGEKAAELEGLDALGEEPLAAAVPAVVRKIFADTAFWAAALVTDKDGVAEVALNMPENLTGWKVKAWAMGLGTKVGQGEAEIVTKKNLLVRLQAPRFFVEKDEVVLSANVHNYLEKRQAGRCAARTGRRIRDRVRRFEATRHDRRRR